MVMYVPERRCSHRTYDKRSEHVPRSNMRMEDVASNWDMLNAETRQQPTNTSGRAWTMGDMEEFAEQSEILINKVRCSMSFLNEDDIGFRRQINQ